jgi:hypothetical protein
MTLKEHPHRPPDALKRKPREQSWRTAVLRDGIFCHERELGHAQASRQRICSAVQDAADWDRKWIRPGRDL